MEWIIKKVLPLPEEPSRRALAAGRPGVFRDMGVALLSHALSSKGATDKGLSRKIRAERRLGSKDRPLVMSVLYGVLRRKRLLERLLLEASHPIDSLNLWQLELMLSQGLKPEDVGLSECLHDSAGVLKEWLDQKDVEHRDALSTLTSLPLWLVENLSGQESEEDLVSLCLSLSEPAQTTLRVNTLRCTVEELSRVLQEQGVSIQSGFYSLEALRVDGRPNLMGSKAFREGLFEIQDEASQLIAELVEPVRGGLHLDYCAGAGGKSLALAAKLPRQAKILATDIRESALKRAEHRAERAGAKRIAFHCLQDGPLPIAAQSAARVLVDAPCTGTGTLRRQPVRKWRMTERDLSQSIRLQEQILRDASAWVRPGGRLVYATCSVLRAENEEIVRAFLEEHPAWSLVFPREILGRSRSKPFEREGFFRSYPHLHSTDGFTAAILVAPRAEPL